MRARFFADMLNALSLLHVACLAPSGAGQNRLTQVQSGCAANHHPPRKNHCVGSDTKRSSW